MVDGSFGYPFVPGRMCTMNLDKLTEWLESTSYRTSTKKYTVRQGRQAYARYLADPTQEPTYDTVTSLKRVVLFLRETGDDPAFLKWLAAFGVQPPNRTPMPKNPGRKLSAESFPERDYHAIIRATAKENKPEAHVLYVLATTGLRIGDVLRIPLDHLEVALQSAKQGSKGVLPLERKGGTWIQVPIAGALDAWQRLYEDAQEHENIASYASYGSSESPEPGDPAYIRCHRYFKDLGERLSLPGRVHLHRLRRTVAVRGLAATDGDLMAVSQMLGHTSVRATERYVDEINVSRVATIQQKIRSGLVN